MKAYAIVLYLRIKEGTKFQTNLLFSKMRLVPTARGKKGQICKTSDNTMLRAISYVDWG